MVLPLWPEVTIGVDEDEVEAAVGLDSKKDTEDEAAEAAVLSRNIPPSAEGFSWPPLELTEKMMLPGLAKVAALVVRTSLLLLLPCCCTRTGCCWRYIDVEGCRSVVTLISNGAVTGVSSG